MISAKDAREQAGRNYQDMISSEIARVEAAINSQVAKGKFTVSVVINYPETRMQLEHAGFYINKLPEDPRDQRSSNLYDIWWQ